MDLVQQIEALVEPVLSAAGIELVQTEYRRETIGWVLRFYLDKAGGFSLVDCTEWTDRLGLALDESGLITHAYSLEISSPGLSRPLRKREDFARFLGIEVIIKTHEPLNNQKNYHGKMLSLEGDVLMLMDRSSGLVRLPLNAIASAKLDPEIK